MVTNSIKILELLQICQWKRHLRKSCVINLWLKCSNSTSLASQRWQVNCVEIERAMVFRICMTEEDNSWTVTLSRNFLSCSQQTLLSLRNDVLLSYGLDISLPLTIAVVSFPYREIDNRGSGGNIKDTILSGKYLHKAQVWSKTTNRKPPTDVTLRQTLYWPPTHFDFRTQSLPNSKLLRIITQLHFGEYK